MRTIGLAAASMFLAVAASAASPRTPPDLRWLDGAWCSDADGKQVRETWLSEAGGHRFGVSHTLQDGNLAGFEYLRIGPNRAGDIVYDAQPGGAPPTSFALTDSGPAHARFENPAHDFPQRIDYRRTGDTLRAEIAGPGQDGEMVIGSDYTRCGG